MTILLQRINLKNQLMPFLFALLLAGCSSLFGSSFTGVLKNDANANSEFYMNKIEQTPDLEDQQTYKLLAARVLVTENKTAQAEALLAELKDLKEEQLLDKSIIDAHISAVKGNNETAENQLKLINLGLLSPSQRSRYYEVAARIAENRNNPIDAVKARIQVDTFLTDTQRKQANNDRTWALLRSANKGAINNASAEGSAALGGWLALARAYNDNLNQPSQLSMALQNWKAAYPNHSAAYLFPTELQGLFNFQQTNLNQIALLLPLSGDAQLIGNTIKKGFDDAKGDSAVQVQVFDTMSASIDDILAQAKQQGISTVVGPLLKQNVDMILNNPSAVQGLNVLTLNSTAGARAIGQLCYYGLAPEDEAESAADRIWNEGIRNPLVIVPQSDLGQRTASAFNVRWQRLAATDANIKFYNQADDINFALQSGLSENAQALYIVATSEQLAEIKTVIDNAGTNLKLYASSRSNSPNNGPEYRLLMNGLQFSDIPFFKDIDSDQYKKVAAFTNGDYSLMRLYAMGSDAWLLINQFNELRQVPGFSITGLTGKLSAGPNCNIERDMTWFQYQNGEIGILSN
ncbi:penicillin-binding protein activator [Caviibacterium pharyngocola]|uniref:Penicillin-binding protein activator LpoA n=1 Tax=Caviibacterium pharyngocola TaxID=28159 RepID=A0A2M8RYR3_9PAST|nr:penicillin-binding protein activator [Caviibacterium pharyngocola]PJG84015.1 penicillin-binding protein activator [Caviibacterium pharyngocola]